LALAILARVPPRLVSPSMFVSAIHGASKEKATLRKLDSTFEDFEQDDFDCGSDLTGDTPSKKRLSGQGRLRRSKSTLDRINATTEDYAKEAVELIIAADEAWVNRDVLKRAVAVQQRRLFGCLDLHVRCMFFLMFALSAYLHEDITNVYMIESGLRTEFSVGLDELESVADVWHWVNTSFLPKMFKQTDSEGELLADKLHWSKVLMYNQLQGPVVLKQARSKMERCEDPSPAIGPSSSVGIAGHMMCYLQSSTSTDPFGKPIQVSVAEPVDNEYAGGDVTVEERLAYYSSAFEAGSRSDGRRLRIMRPQYIHRLPSGAADDDSFLVFLYPNTNYSLIQEHVNYLYDRAWLDLQSKELTVRALLLNTEVGRPRLEEVFIQFAFSRGGGVFTRITLESLFLRTWHNMTSVAADLMYLLCVIIFTGIELYKAWKSFRRVSVRKESTFKKILAVLIVVCGWLIVLGLLVQETMRQTVVTRLREVTHAQMQDVPADSNTLGAELMDDTAIATKYNGWFRLLLAEYHLVLLVFFFTAFEAQPRLGIVIHTLESSFIDILHFLLVLAPTFVAFAISGCFIFGRRIEEFSTFEGAVGMCFKLMMEGEFDWAVLSEEHWFTSVLWTWTFVILMVLLMLNMVLGIILDVYTLMRKQSGSSETVVETIRQLLQRARHAWVWVRAQKLLDAMESMPLHFTADELRKHFPEMCDAQFKSLLKDCRSQTNSDGHQFKDWAGSMQLILAVQLNLDKVKRYMRQYMRTDAGPEDPREKLWYEKTTENRGWLQQLSERMAVQNHSLLALQWALQQLQWQHQAMDAMYGPNGQLPSPRRDLPDEVQVEPL